MSKKDALLTEGQVRQFMKLANLEPLAPGFVHGLKEGPEGSSWPETPKRPPQKPGKRPTGPIGPGNPEDAPPPPDRGDPWPGVDRGRGRPWKPKPPPETDRWGIPVKKGSVKERARRAYLTRALLEELGDDIHMLEGERWDKFKKKAKGVGTWLGKQKDKLAQVPWVGREKKDYGGLTDRRKEAGTESSHGDVVHKGHERYYPKASSTGGAKAGGTGLSQQQIDAAKDFDEAEKAREDKEATKYAPLGMSERRARAHMIGSLLEQLGMEDEELMDMEEFGPEGLEGEDLDVEEVPLPPEEEELGGGQQVSVDDFLTALEVALEDVLGDEVEVEQEEELGDLDVEDAPVEDVDVEEEEPLELQEMVNLITRRVAKRIVKEALNKK